jgi:hemoglobin
MTDIESRADLHQVLSDFYSTLIEDELLAPLFVKFKDQETLSSHLIDLADFWESALFYRGSYTKNVMSIHQRINEKTQLDGRHFDQWLLLFEKAVDDSFSGQNADTLKARARSIATVMQIKFGSKRS